MNENKKTAKYIMPGDLGYTAYCLVNIYNRAGWCFGRPEQPDKFIGIKTFFTEQEALQEIELYPQLRTPGWEIIRVTLSAL